MNNRSSAALYSNASWNHPELLGAPVHIRPLWVNVDRNAQGTMALTNGVSMVIITLRRPPGFPKGRRHMRRLARVAFAQAK